MTGGWPRQRNDEQYRYERRRPVASLGVGAGANERRLNEALQNWSQVWRLRRAVNRDLKMLGTSFPQWRVLYVTQQLTREDSEGVSELEVADHTDMDVSTVSSVLHRLERKGLVDRGQEECEYTYHVLVTDAGQRLLAEALPCMGRFADALSAMREGRENDSRRIDEEHAAPRVADDERGPERSRSDSDAGGSVTPGAAAEH